MDAGFKAQHGLADCTNFALHPPQQSLRYPYAAETDMNNDR
jgi:hypothetical protein